MGSMPMITEGEADEGEGDMLMTAGTCRAEREVSRSRPRRSVPKGASIVANRFSCIAERATTAAETVLQMARAVSVAVSGSNLAAWREIKRASDRAFY